MRVSILVMLAQFRHAGLLGEHVRRGSARGHAAVRVAYGAFRGRHWRTRAAADVGVRVHTVQTEVNTNKQANEIVLVTY